MYGSQTLSLSPWLSRRSQFPKSKPTDSRRSPCPMGLANFRLHPPFGEIRKWLIGFLAAAHHTYHTPSTSRPEEHPRKDWKSPHKSRSPRGPRFIFFRLSCYSCSAYHRPRHQNDASHSCSCTSRIKEVKSGVVVR